MVKYVYAEIIGLVQLWPWPGLGETWPWPGLGVELTGLGLGLEDGALALEPVALLTDSLYASDYNTSRRVTLATVNQSINR